MLDNLIVKLFITFGITLLILGCATESVPPPPRSRRQQVPLNQRPPRRCLLIRLFLPPRCPQLQRTP